MGKKTVGGPLPQSQLNLQLQAAVHPQDRGVPPIGAQGVVAGVVGGVKHVVEGSLVVGHFNLSEWSGRMRLEWVMRLRDESTGCPTVTAPTLIGNIFRKC